MNTATVTLDSPVGALALVASDDALCLLSWDGDRSASVDALVAGSARRPDHPLLAQTAEELDEYFAGSRREFEVAVHAPGTAFQQAAWRALCTIPYGETISYGEQARRVGNPRAVRAVGGANGRNPVGIIVPCHRVIGANGSLTGFGGGMEAKAWLLEHERRIAAH